MSQHSYTGFELPTFDRQLNTLQLNGDVGELECIYNEYSMFDVDISTSTTSTSLKKNPHKRSRHTPHSEQPVDKVEKRNARERCRMHGVNGGLKRLSNLLPLKRKNKRVSKENILKMATVYITELRRMIREHDAEVEAGHLAPRPSDGSAVAASCQHQYPQAAGQCWSNNTSTSTWLPVQSYASGDGDSSCNTEMVKT